MVSNGMEWGSVPLCPRPSSSQRFIVWGTQVYKSLSKWRVLKRDILNISVEWLPEERVDPNSEALDDILSRLEFRSLLPRLMGTEVNDKPTRYDASRVEYVCVSDITQLMELCQSMTIQPCVALDTETTSTDSLSAELVGVSLSWEAGWGVYVPVPLPDGTGVDAIMNMIASSLSGVVIGQNLSYDIQVLARHGATITAPVVDTMVAHQLLEPDSSHGMDTIAKLYLNYETIPISELLGNGDIGRTMCDVPLDQLVPYACEDADITLRLWLVFQKKLREEGLLDIALSMAFPLVPAVASMEARGVAVNVDAVASARETLKDRMNRLSEEAARQAGQAFNLRSNKQAARALYEKVGLDVVFRTASGAPSASRSALLELTPLHPLPSIILDWRRLDHLVRRYLPKLYAHVRSDTGRVHPRYWRAMTAKAKMRSSHPNLEMFCDAGMEGEAMRRIFVAPDGYSLIVTAYSHPIMRILASLSGDPELHLDLADADPCESIAARVFGCSPGALTDEERFNGYQEFLRWVGCGDPSVEVRYPLNRANVVIRETIESHVAYPTLMRWQSSVVRRARIRGFVKTLFGRECEFPCIPSRDGNESIRQERLAVRFTVMGTLLDTLKTAMIGMHNRLVGTQSGIILQAHNEIVVEAAANERDAVCSAVRQEMERACPDVVPLAVRIQCANHWVKTNG